MTKSWREYGSFLASNHWFLPDKLAGDRPNADSY